MFYFIITEKSLTPKSVKAIVTTYCSLGGINLESDDVDGSGLDYFAVSKDHIVGLCDMDKKNLSRFFDQFCDFDFNHDFDTHRHALQS